MGLSRDDPIEKGKRREKRMTYGEYEVNGGKNGNNRNEK